jgi:hypothetical protein
LGGSAGSDFDVVRAQQRAIDEGRQTAVVLDVFLRLFDALSDAGDDDELSYDRARERFWSEIDAVRYRG